MLDIHSLSVRFWMYSGLMRQVQVPVLDQVSLSVKRGEILALIGASGSGKSILAQAILGHLPKNAECSGEIVIDGQARSADERRALCNQSFALVPQSLSYLDPLARCGKQIAWSAQRAGRPVTGEAETIEDRLARFHLEPDVRNAFPHELSGGMARRVLLSVATAGEADLLIADEPTSGLDHENAGAVLAHLRALADKGHAVLLITHDLAGALEYADHVAVLREGRLDTVTSASNFAADGQRLPTSYSRALWRALPMNIVSNRLAKSA